MRDRLALNILIDFRAEIQRTTQRISTEMSPLTVLGTLSVCLASIRILVRHDVMRLTKMMLSSAALHAAASKCLQSNYYDNR